MSILENNKELKELAKNIVVQPPVGTWDKIERNIASTNDLKKVKLKYRLKYWLSIAASICVILACITFIYSESKLPQKIHRVEFVSLENLAVSEDYFYSLANARNNNKLQPKTEGVSSFIDLNSLKGTSLLPVVFRDYPL